MKISDVAKVLGQSPATIRAGLRLGIYDFGAAFKQPGNKKYTYTLYPQKLKEILGADYETDKD